MPPSGESRGRHVGARTLAPTSPSRHYPTEASVDKNGTDLANDIRLETATSRDDASMQSYRFRSKPVPTAGSKAHDENEVRSSGGKLLSSVGAGTDDFLGWLLPTGQKVPREASPRRPGGISLSKLTGNVDNQGGSRKQDRKKDSSKTRRLAPDATSGPSHALRTEGVPLNPVTSAESAAEPAPAPAEVSLDSNNQHISLAIEPLSKALLALQALLTEVNPSYEAGECDVMPTDTSGARSPSLETPHVPTHISPIGGCWSLADVLPERAQAALESSSQQVTMLFCCADREGLGRDGSCCGSVYSGRCKSHTNSYCGSRREESCCSQRSSSNKKVRNGSRNSKRGRSKQRCGTCFEDLTSRHSSVCDVSRRRRTDTDTDSSDDFQPTSLKPQFSGQRSVRRGRSPDCCRVQRRWCAEYVAPSSQYSLGSISACTVFAFEACLLYQGAGPPQPSEALVSYILSTVPTYTSDLHSSVAEVYDGKQERFRKYQIGLDRIGLEFQLPLAKIVQLPEHLISQAMSGNLRTSASAVIIKPPESISVHWTVPSAPVHIFDSHPRPELGLFGAAILVFATWADVVAHLAALWPECPGAPLTMNLIEAHVFGSSQPSREGPVSTCSQDIPSRTADAVGMEIRYILQEAGGTDFVSKYAESLISMGMDSARLLAQAPREDLKDCGITLPYHQTVIIRAARAAVHGAETDRHSVGQSSVRAGRGSAILTQVEAGGDDAQPVSCQDPGHVKLLREMVFHAKSLEMLTGGLDGNEAQESPINEQSSNTDSQEAGQWPSCGTASSAPDVAQRVEEKKAAVGVSKPDGVDFAVSGRKDKATNATRNQKSSPRSSAKARGSKPKPKVDMVPPDGQATEEDSDVGSFEALKQYIAAAERNPDLQMANPPQDAMTDTFVNGVSVDISDKPIVPGDRDDPKAEAGQLHRNSLNCTATRLQLGEICRILQEEHDREFAALFLDDEDVIDGNATEDEIINLIEDGAETQSAQQVPDAMPEVLLDVNHNDGETLFPTVSGGHFDVIIPNILEDHGMGFAAMEEVLIQESFKCPICFEDRPFDDVLLPHGSNGRGCRLCRSCARESFVQSVSQGVVPISCPICIAEAVKGPAAHLGQEVVCTVLDEKEQIDFHRRALEMWRDSDPNVKPCPIADCLGVGIVETTDPRCCCNICMHEWCGQCGAAHDVNVSCAEYERWLANNGMADRLLQDMVANRELRECPNCKNGVMKEEGCNHMTCRCGYHFCYLCGKKLDQRTPYSHYNPPGPNKCVLFEGQGGHGRRRGRRGGNRVTPPFGVAQAPNLRRGER